jgi:hypothetical protein
MNGTRMQFKNAKIQQRPVDFWFVIGLLSSTYSKKLGKKLGSSSTMKRTVRRFRMSMSYLVGKNMGGVLDS